MPWFTTISMGGNLREKEVPIGRGSFGLVFVTRNGHGGKVVIKKLLSEDDQEKCLFIKEAKILHGINSKHIAKFEAACMEPCAMMLEYLFFDFAPLGGSAIVSSLDRLLQHIHMNEAIGQFRALRWVNVTDLGSVSGASYVIADHYVFAIFFLGCGFA